MTVLYKVPPRHEGRGNYQCTMPSAELSSIYGLKSLPSMTSLLTTYLFIYYVEYALSAQTLVSDRNHPSRQIIQTTTVKRGNTWSMKGTCN